MCEVRFIHKMLDPTSICWLGIILLLLCLLTLWCYANTTARIRRKTNRFSDTSWGDLLRHPQGEIVRAYINRNCTFSESHERLTETPTNAKFGWEFNWPSAEAFQKLLQNGHTCIHRPRNEQTDFLVYSVSKLNGMVPFVIIVLS